jgi:sterol desaturase/sphingolipid hydroxylase (fatty acid hydroxylase superfamily)
MGLTAAVFAKLLLVLMGAVAFERSFAAYRRRRRDPRAQPDPVSDRAWRVLGVGAAIVLASCLVLLILRNVYGPLPDWLVMPGAALIIVGILGVFGACAVLGWRSVP